MAFQTIDGKTSGVFGPDGKPSGQTLVGDPARQGWQGISGGVPQNIISTGAGYASGINTGIPINVDAIKRGDIPLTTFKTGPFRRHRSDSRKSSIDTDTKRSSFREGEYNEWLNEYTELRTHEKGLFSEGFEISPYGKEADNSTSLTSDEDGKMVPNVVYTAYQGAGPTQISHPAVPLNPPITTPTLGCDPCAKTVDGIHSKDYRCLDPRCDRTVAPAASTIRCDTISGCGSMSNNIKRPIFSGTYTTYDAYEFGADPVEVTGYFTIKTNPIADFPPIPGRPRPQNMNRCDSYYIDAISQEVTNRCCSSKAESLSREVGRICTWKWAVTFLGTDFTGISNRANCEQDKPLRDPDRWAYEGNPCYTGGQSPIDSGYIGGPGGTSGNLYMCSCQDYQPCKSCKVHVLIPIGAYLEEGTSGDPCECLYAYNKGAKFLSTWSGAMQLTGCGTPDHALAPLNAQYSTVWTGCAPDKINPDYPAGETSGDLPGYGNQSQKYAIASGRRPYWDDVTCGWMTPLSKVNVPNRFQTGCMGTGNKPLSLPRGFQPYGQHKPSDYCPSGDVLYVSDRYIFDCVNRRLPLGGASSSVVCGDDVEYCCCTGKTSQTGTMCDRVYETGAAYVVGEYVHFDGSGTETLFEYPPCGVSGNFTGVATGYQDRKWDDRNWQITDIRWSGVKGTESVNGISGFDCGYVYTMYHTTCKDEPGSCANGFYIYAREDSLSRSGLATCPSGVTGVATNPCTGIFESGLKFHPTQLVCWNGQTSSPQYTGTYASPCSSGAGCYGSGGGQQWFIHEWQMQQPDGTYAPFSTAHFSGSRTGVNTGNCDWLYAVQCMSTGGGAGGLTYATLSGITYTGIRQSDLSTGCCP